MSPSIDREDLLLFRKRDAGLHHELLTLPECI